MGAKSKLKLLPACPRGGNLENMGDCRLQEFQGHHRDRRPRITCAKCSRNFDSHIFPLNNAIVTLNNAIFAEIGILAVGFSRFCLSISETLHKPHAKLGLHRTRPISCSSRRSSCAKSVFGVYVNIGRHYINPPPYWYLVHIIRISTIDDVITSILKVSQVSATFIFSRSFYLLRIASQHFLARSLGSCSVGAAVHAPRIGDSAHNVARVGARCLNESRR